MRRFDAFHEAAAVSFFQPPSRKDIFDTFRGRPLFKAFRELNALYLELLNGRCQTF
jgi:hypothetical protein